MSFLSIYEGDFLGFSYGARPGKSQHNALDAIYVAITQKKVSFVLDADIRSFYDSLNHDWLMKFVEHRVADKRVLLKTGRAEEMESRKHSIFSDLLISVQNVVRMVNLSFSVKLSRNDFEKESKKFVKLYNAIDISRW